MLKTPDEVYLNPKSLLPLCELYDKYDKIPRKLLLQVISSEGLTKDRLEILQKLLEELSRCDEEAKFAVEALQQILSELQPQGKKCFDRLSLIEARRTRVQPLLQPDFMTFAVKMILGFLCTLIMWFLYFDTAIKSISLNTKSTTYTKFQGTQLTLFLRLSMTHPEKSLMTVLLPNPSHLP